MIPGFSGFKLFAAIIGAVARRRQGGSAPGEGSAGSLAARQSAGERININNSVHTIAMACAKIEGFNQPKHCL